MTGYRQALRLPMEVLLKQEFFWSDDRQSSIPDLIRYSFFLGFFPFAGYLVQYTLRGTIWNVWPFVQTTLDVGSGLMFAALQWIFFAMFPVLSSLFIELLFSRSKQTLLFEEILTICTYSITPLCLSLLFIGVPFFDRISTTLGFATFLFLLYYGCRSMMKFTILRSMVVTFLVFVVFALIRQIFVFAIGY